MNFAIDGTEFPSNAATPVLSGSCHVYDTDSVTGPDSFYQLNQSEARQTVFTLQVVLLMGFPLYETLVSLKCLLSS